MDSFKESMTSSDHHDKPRSLVAISVVGTFYEVGYEVGKKFREEIDHFYKATSLFDNLLPFYHTEEGRQIYEEYLNITNDVYPQYVRELEGIADGSGRPFHEVFLVHIEPEITTMLRTSRGIEPKSAQCTTLMLNYKDGNGQQQTILAHNEDITVTMNKAAPYMVHARIIPGPTESSSSVGEEWSSYCYPGHNAGNTVSVNGHGLAVAINRLFADNVQRGMIPFYIATRALLSCNSIDAAEELVRTDMHRVALGMSVSLAFFPADDAEQMLANIEVAPTDKDAAYGSNNVDVKKIPVASSNEDGFYYHFNRYDRIKGVKDWPGEYSSDHRKTRLESLPAPSNVDDILAILGDTEDSEFPVYRSGKELDYLKTAATGVFDIMTRSFALYTNNPTSGSGPVMKMSIANSPKYCKH